MFPEKPHCVDCGMVLPLQTRSIKVVCQGCRHQRYLKNKISEEDPSQEEMSQSIFGTTIEHAVDSDETCDEDSEPEESQRFV